MTRIAEALFGQLSERSVDCVLGIPGVHTIELYRGLAASGIRHITPLHEQGAGFMADGYSRVSGKPGVAFVITGPGLSNTITEMGQVRADSVPMLVVSGVNTLPSLGKGVDHLHELPDQRAMAQTVALGSERVENACSLTPALNRAFAAIQSRNPGPTHIEKPLDVAGAEYSAAAENVPPPPNHIPDPGQTAEAATLLTGAKTPVLLAVGGARHAGNALRTVAERLGAPVVQTVNACGIMFDHPLGVPASPSLQAVRDLIVQSDVVLAVGTELGPTDYDMCANGTMAPMNALIRIDLCPAQLSRDAAKLPILSDAKAALEASKAHIEACDSKLEGAWRADKARHSAFEEIDPEMRALCDVLAAAIGAALAAPDAPVLCIAGDGSAQFSLPVMMCAVNENLPICFIIWNDHGFHEIATSMQAAGVCVVECDPTPPDFAGVAQSCGMPFWRCGPEPDAVADALRSGEATGGPTLIEIRAGNHSRAH